MAAIVRGRAGGIAAAAMLVLLVSANVCRARATDEAAALAATWARARYYLPAALNPTGTGPIGGGRDLASIARALAAIPAGR